MPPSSTARPSHPSTLSTTIPLPFLFDGITFRLFWAVTNPFNVSTIARIPFSCDTDHNPLLSYHNDLLTFSVLDRATNQLQSTAGSNLAQPRTGASRAGHVHVLCQQAPLSTRGTKIEAQELREEDRRCRINVNIKQIGPRVWVWFVFVSMIRLEA
ncbi:hypothetical protein ONZ45_g13230 [Pleurotus djamor]|nr:hypothetical protein ONZ45_g13230 [Pleurotus djamor]